MEKRGSFSTRLGFILVSAGCAIGLGNVWRFPYITGQYGGASFVLIYLVFLAILGLPIMVAEFAVGRASVRSAAMSFDELERISEEIEQNLQNSLEREVSTEAIGEQVMDKLRSVDEVAYVRFASVYRQFKDIDTFMHELNKLLADKT